MASSISGKLVVKRAQLTAPTDIASLSTSLSLGELGLTYNSGATLGKLFVGSGNATEFGVFMDSQVKAAGGSVATGEVSSIGYLGTSSTTAGYFNSSTTNPSGTTRLNYEGYLYSTQLYDSGSRVLTAESDTLATVTGRGATTSANVSLTSSTESSSTTTGALVVTGGAGIGGNLNVAGNLVITGNITASGTTTTINTEEILLADNIIVLNSNYTGSAPSENAGIEIERGTLSNVTIRWNETTDKWEATNNGSTFYNLDAGYTGSQGVGYTGSQGYTGSASTVIGYTGSQGIQGYTGSSGVATQVSTTATTTSATYPVVFVQESLIAGTPVSTGNKTYAVDGSTGTTFQRLTYNPGTNLLTTGGLNVGSGSGDTTVLQLDGSSGTDGQYIRSGGAAADPTWGDVEWDLVYQTTFNSTLTVTITSANAGTFDFGTYDYKIVYKGERTGEDNTMVQVIELNDDTANGKHAYRYSTVQTSGTSAATVTNAAGDGSASTTSGIVCGVTAKLGTLTSGTGATISTVEAVITRSIAAYSTYYGYTIYGYSTADFFTTDGAETSTLSYGSHTTFSGVYEDQTSANLTSILFDGGLYDVSSTNNQRISVYRRKK